MWGASEEPPGTMEGGPPEAMVHAKETCEQNKSQLESLKEIMLKNKQTLKKKEEEVQEYARRLSKIKSRARLSRRSKETATPKDVSQQPMLDAMVADAPEETIDDISQATTPKAKTTLLQKKLAENRKVFEQRSKEITETKRAVVEKVEAMKQLLDEKDVAMMGMHKDQLSVMPVRPVVVTSDVMSPIQLGNMQEKENKIAELNDKITALEATVLDLQENLKEKDSVIESKTKAVMLMSADLSKKGKTTLDTLEDTKDEMRTMQEHFVLLETSLKNKNENLLEQLQERDNKILELEETVKRHEQQISEQKEAESASVDFSRSTMDTLVETKDAMKSMQENFVLIESSLKAKNDNLLQQLEEYELKLAEANERIFQLESGAGIVKDPTVTDLQYKLERLEQNNKQLQDEKYVLQKSIADMQDKIINKSVHDDGAIIEKDNRIVELEKVIKELKEANKLLQEESKAGLQNELAQLTLKNEEYSNKVVDLEKVVHDLQIENRELIAKLADDSEATKENERFAKLTKELEELNKSMIKMKAQHRNKVKNLQKQLENFKTVSDTNAELVRLGNQVALLEEEKGNLQLSLVDFDELKVSAGDWQERIADLESKVAVQAKEIQMHTEAIATLENQKLDLMQELHVAKQEISALEAENAESENLRVTVEMKVVDLEEQLEFLSKSQNESKLDSSSETTEAELLKKIEILAQENNELYNKLTKLEEKGTSDTGSTESFEAIQESDKSDLIKKIEELTQRNNELTDKLNKLEEKANSQAGSTESFEAINDTDKSELLRRIDQLTQENADLMVKLSRIEEKGSSDAGSTESFERIPEHNEGLTKIELLTQENTELVIKFTKLEEQLERVESSRLSEVSGAMSQIDTLLEMTEDQSLELTKLRTQVTDFSEENANLQKRIEALVAENNDLAIKHTKLEERIALLQSEKIDSPERPERETDTTDQVAILIEEKSFLEKEIKELRNTLEQSQNKLPQEIRIEDLELKVQTLSNENAALLLKIDEMGKQNNSLQEELVNLMHEKKALEIKLEQITSDDAAKERLELIDKLEKLSQEKEYVAHERQELHEQISTLLHRSADEPEMQKADEPISQQAKSLLVTSLEHEIEECKKLILEQTSIIEEMRIKLTDKEKELEEKGALIVEYTSSGQRAEKLEQELKEMLNVIDEWKYKCNEIQEKMQVLEAGKASIEEGFRTLQTEYELLLEEKKEKDVASNMLKEQLESNIALLESKLEKEVENSSIKDKEINNLKEIIESKDQELHAKYVQLQNEMIVIDGIQDELQNYKVMLDEKNAALASLSDQFEQMKLTTEREKEEELYSLKKEIERLHVKLQESKSLEDYHNVTEQLQHKDAILNELQTKFNEITKENDNQLLKIQELMSHNEDVENQLTNKQHEFSSVLSDKEYLTEQIAVIENEKSHAEKRIWELQNALDTNNKFVEDLKIELKEGYKQMELLKDKHMEDIQMQNQRLETLIEELSNKTQENEALKNELEEKEKLIGQNMTEEVKVALEDKIADLSQKLLNSEDKIQAQLEKMKKIAANLKKKSAMCQELEARVAELEEKWTTEKDEKEAKNKKIQEVEILIREKDNLIADLEDRLKLARNETAEASVKIEGLTHDLTISKETISSLTEQVTEMEEEIVKLRVEVESLTAELATERGEKENLISTYENYRQDIVQEREQKQAELDEVKEKARELSVRMQVMESEYVEQLSVINNLRAEIGMLLSKQSQIQEKLENAEKESEERRFLLEKLQKDVINTATKNTQTSQEESAESNEKPLEIQHCDCCEQYQTSVQALEAKVRERDAEIENLNNELANSVRNFAQMRESMKYNDLMNQTAMRNSVFTLTISADEIKRKLEDTMEENKELVEKMESLQSVNDTLENRIVMLQEQLQQEGEGTKDLQNTDLTNSDLKKKCEQQEAELLNLQKQLQDIQQHSVQLDQQLSSQSSLFEVEKQELFDKEKSLISTKENLEHEIAALNEEKNSNLKKLADLEIELQSYKQQAVEIEKRERERSIFCSESEKDDSTLQLFDASKIFDTPCSANLDTSNEEAKKLQKLLDEKEVHCANLTAELETLQTSMIKERSQMSQNYDSCTAQLRHAEEQFNIAQTNLEKLERSISEKDKEIEALQNEVSNVHKKMAEQCERNSRDDGLIHELKSELNSTRDSLELLTTKYNDQRHELETCKIEIADLKAKSKNFTENELIRELEERISSTVKERDLLQLQINNLSQSLNESKHLGESQRDLELEIKNVQRERDEAKKNLAILTQRLKDSQKSTIEDTTETEDPTSIEPSAFEEVQLTESKPIEQHVEQVVHQDIGSSWETGAAEKLTIDEETWGWNADDVQMVADHDLTTTLVPNAEVQLRAMVDDLQDRIKDLTSEKEKLLEENKALQVRSAKMIKKLKEYKVQMDSLQQQLKIQKSASDFYELDSAIEEELKSQISKLEKTVGELREEQKKVNIEKETLLKRLDVLTSANERYMEMKERQDMDMEVLRIQNKELANKLQILDIQLQENTAGFKVTEASQPGRRGEEGRVSATAHEIVKPVVHEQLQKRSTGEDQLDSEALTKKYKDEIDDLKDEMEALATENEQLQQFLEEQKAQLISLEAKRVTDEQNFNQTIDELNKKASDLQTMFNKSKEEYDVLRKQYEQSLMDANDQISIMRQNVELRKTESEEKMSKLEVEMSNLQHLLDASETKRNELQKNLQEIVEEKAQLEEKVSSLQMAEERFTSANLSLAEVTDLLNVRIQEVADLKQELQKQYIDRENAESVLQNNIQKLLEELDEKKQELNNLRQSFSDKEKELIQQKSVETVSAIVSQATQELVQKHAIDIEGKDKELHALKEIVSILEMNVQKCDQGLQDYQIQLDGQEQEIELLKQTLAEKDAQLNTLQSTTNENLKAKQLELLQAEEKLGQLEEKSKKYLEENDLLRRRLNDSEMSSINMDEYNTHVQSLQEEIGILRSTLSERESDLKQHEQTIKESEVHLEACKTEINQLRMAIHEVDVLKDELHNKTEQINYLASELDFARSALEESKEILKEKTALLEATNKALNDKQIELEKLSAENKEEFNASNIVDGLPLFRMGDSESDNLRDTINSLKADLESKQQEIDHLKYILNENTYPGIIQEMQDRINSLYNEKTQLEASLQTAAQTLSKKEKEVNDLKQCIDTQNQQLISKEDANLVARERRSLKEQEEIVKLQNELHVKEQEINDLKYIIAEKDSQLSLQASMEQPSDDFELRDMVQRLTTELYGKEQEIQHLKTVIADLQKEVSRLQQFEKFYEEKRDTVEMLTAEKVQIRLEAENHLEEKLKEKEIEIDQIKQQLFAEKQKILDIVQLKDKDIENLKIQLEESSLVEKHVNYKLQEKEEELSRLSADIAEKDRRLAELSITKDAELHNLKVQIHEKDVRIEELLALSEEEEKQLVELRSSLESRETEINALKKLLEDKVTEYELIRHALKKDVPVVDVSPGPSAESPSNARSKESTSQELDLALYMLHQRDVRCEELTHELMQLLEERDTLQLRLSNAIRVNEELRRMGNSELSPKKELMLSDDPQEPMIEHPSPSKSEGPIEIAKEAIDAPIGEDKEALAVKLSQLHTVSHAKDVRLRDERESRHTQQMSLLAHKDVLSTLPPEAAARIVNANYTLSRDVQSQSSVLLNWLWGRSTPKVVHM